MSEFRRRLMMSIKNNSGMSIKDVMEELDVIIPGGALTSYSISYNFEYGKTYHIITKVARNVPTGAFSFYVYKSTANTPNVLAYECEQGEVMSDFTYTHNSADTYTRLGAWTAVPSERNANYPIIVYIEEL